MAILLRAAAPADNAALAGLINAHSLAVVGTRRALIDADGDLRTARYIPGAAERLIIEVAGRTAALATVHSAAPHVVVETMLWLHPAAQTAGLADALLDELEAQARRRIALAPSGARVVQQTTILAEDTFMRDRLVAHGFQPAREWVHFELELTGAPVVEAPPGITLRPMDPRRDWPAVGAVMDAAFADHWGEMGPDVRTLLEADEPDVGTVEGLDEEQEGEEEEDDPYSNSPGLCFVAEADGQVIGSCLCNARTIEWPDAGKLGSLSVLRSYRRAGVGQALTAAVLAEFHRRGIGRVITDTDNGSFTGANRLYPRFGFRPYRYEVVLEKELRAGVEWRRLSPAAFE